MIAIRFKDHSVRHIECAYVTSALGVLILHGTDGHVSGHIPVREILSMWHDPCPRRR